jgi:hypothetical protein
MQKRSPAPGVAQTAARFMKTHAQGELTTREYNRSIKVPTAKGKSIEPPGFL